MINKMSTPLKNQTLLQALHRQPTDYTPIWLMRQAGRYLPEYRKIREKAKDFMTLCQTPALACEITLQPLRRFPFDAAIIFSDILTVPDAMGLDLYFIEGEGPKFRRPLRNAADIEQLQLPEIETQLQYVMQTIDLVKKELANKLPLIGFSGSPWTLATYMIEGGPSQHFTLIKKMLYNQPEILQSLLHLLTDAVIAYLSAQIKAGVDVVMIFDTWGGILTTDAYLKFSLSYMQQIVTALKKAHAEIPLILFTKNGGQWLECIANTHCDAVSLDWTMDIAQARRQVSGKVALQGNLDPAVLYAKPDKIRAEVKKILQNYGENNIGHIFNLGHGILPDTPLENVAVLIETVHNLSTKK